MFKESKSGPSYRSEHGGGTYQEEQQPHLFQSDRVVSRIALGEERMWIRIVPYRPRSVKVLAPDSEVNDLDDAVREEKEGDRVGREIVDVGALNDQIHRAQAEL